MKRSEEVKYRKKLEMLWGLYEEAHSEERMKRDNSDNSGKQGFFLEFVKNKLPKNQTMTLSTWTLFAFSSFIDGFEAGQRQGVRNENGD